MSASPGRWSSRNPRDHRDQVGRHDQRARRDAADHPEVAPGLEPRVLPRTGPLARPGALVTVLVWMFVIESLIGGLLPSIAPWTPFAAGSAMVTPGGEMAVGVATAIAVGYATLAMITSTWLTERRDTA